MSVSTESPRRERALALLSEASYVEARRYLERLQGGSARGGTGT